MKTFFKYSAFIYFLLIVSNSFAQALVIVQPENVTDELSRNSLRAIFAMRITEWPDGSTIQVFVLEDKNKIHVSFCKNILGMFPYQLRRVWDRQIFSGTGSSPTTVGSEQEMRIRIADTPGAIGYIMAVDKDISLVKIIGEMP